jgi:hypothetical protein
MRMNAMQTRNRSGQGAFAGWLRARGYVAPAGGRRAHVARGASVPLGPGLLQSVPFQPYSPYVSSPL